MSKQSLYPYPVYVAQFADGSTGRLSFWSDTKHPGEFDFARGRKAAAICYARPDGAPVATTNSMCRGYAPISYPPRELADGWVEWRGEKHPDPHFLPGVDPAFMHRRGKRDWKAMAIAARQALQAGDHAKALELLQAA